MKFITKTGKLKKGKTYNEFLARNGISPIDVISFNKKTRKVSYVSVGKNSLSERKRSYKQKKSKTAVLFLHDEYGVADPVWQDAVLRLKRGNKIPGWMLL